VSVTVTTVSLKKSRPKAALNSNPTILDQAAINAGFAFL
jgi:hypothetical protein